MVMAGVMVGFLRLGFGGKKKTAQVVLDGLAEDSGDRF